MAQKILRKKYFKFGIKVFIWVILPKWVYPQIGLFGYLKKLKIFFRAANTKIEEKYDI